MKWIISIVLLIAASILLITSKPAQSDYIVIAWNDLGMHCSNKDFSTLVILPPFNNIRAQVIKKGDGSSYPQIVTTGIKVKYEIPGNTYSVGKTNFWDYAKTLFNVTLQPNVGLTGNGLSGDMRVNSNFFEATGVPITPYTDADLTNEDPYQQALIKVYDMNDNLLATANPVIPVSNEIGCVGSGCHSSEQQILNIHPKEGGFNPNNKPILCAKCHQSNALGTIGDAEAQPLSQRIHSKHSGITDCYKCHPGPKAKCYRDAMFQAGSKCTDCHGTMAQIASTQKNGTRKAWLQEPSCSSSKCHSGSFAPEANKLFKESKGHGNMFCSACHGSPHAIYPTVQPRDNDQIIALQGFAGKIKNCNVCHGVDMIDFKGPHGFTPTSVEELNTNSGRSELGNVYPNPAKGSISIPFSINKNGLVRIIITDSKGTQSMILINELKASGDYKTNFDVSTLPNGAYTVNLQLDRQSIASRNLVINK